ncbi:MAG: 4-hydroxy-3-methylbut-2-enyl diphosphate reductase [Candidatus Omnitrophota bacterium]
MRVKIAKTIGFCQGVRRALDLTKNVLAKSKSPVYSLGQIIHNKGVIEELMGLGLIVINDISKIKDNAILILPSHGVPENIIKELARKKIKIVDTTCPYVSKVYRIAESLKKQNYQIIIYGDKKHPEIRAIKSRIPQAFIVSPSTHLLLDKFIKLKDNNKLVFGIISQTTQAKDKYFSFIYHFLWENSFIKEVRVFNTICADAISRQKEVIELSKEVDAMFIIGGKNSANTKRLNELCQQTRVKTFHIEKISELRNKGNVISRIKTAGIATGASTPSFLVSELLNYLKSK